MQVRSSIVIPNLNGGERLAETIRCVYAQTDQDFELIVIDNASTDESAAECARHVGRPGYTFIRNATNTGFAPAVNQGIAAARGRFVVLLNNDAFPDPDWLAELVRVAESDPRIFSVSALMLQQRRPELVDDAGDEMTLLGMAYKRGDGSPARRFTRPRRVFSACGGAALYRRDLVLELGGFEESFFAYYEDVDLGWRANSAGYRNVYCPTAKCRHVGSATSGAATYSAFKVRQTGRNCVRVPRRNMPHAMLALNALPLAFGLFLHWMLLAMLGFGAEFSRGVREGMHADEPKRRPSKFGACAWIEWHMFVATFGFACQAVLKVTRAIRARIAGGRAAR